MQQSLDKFVSSAKKPKNQEEDPQQPQQTQLTQQPLGSGQVGIPPFPDFIQGLATWTTLLKTFTSSPKMRSIYDYVKKEYETKKCYPPPQLIFNAFASTPLDQLKVVIVGQDPYINENEAMGLCFSVPVGTKVPPSLANMYKNLEKTVKGFKIPKHGDLTKWANQGVFLLNGVLTVEAKKSNSHKDCGWTQFTDEVIRVIDQQCTGLVFLLWGKPSQGKAKKVDRKKYSIQTYKRHHILETSHPSPLSAHNGFMDSNHFVQCNEILVRLGKDPIDWTLA